MKYKGTVLGKIPESWDVLPIKEVTSVVTDYVANGSFASLAENVTYKSEKDVAVIIRLVDYNRNFQGEFVFIDEHAYEFLGKSKLYGGEIIISNVGANVGTVFRCPKLPFKMSLAPNAIMVKFMGNNDFYFHWLRSHSGQQMLKSLVTGSAQPKFNKTNFRAMSVPVPPLEIQDKVASILNSLDDRIELNQRINNNLEEQAAALFQQVFINNADASWEKGTISDLGIVVGGSTPSKAKDEYYAERGIAWITPKDLSINKSKFISHGVNDITELGLKNCSTSIMPKGTVLFSSRAPIGYIAIAENEMTTNQGFKSVVPKPEIGTAFVYYFLKYNLPIIEGMASGSTFKEVSGSIMKNVPAFIPDCNTLSKFTDFCAPIFAQQQVLEHQNQSLIELRDSLLPRLMSGELDVSEIDL